MQPSEENFAHLQQLLLQTLDKDNGVRRQGESSINGAMSTAGFPTVLLAFIQYLTQDMSPQGRAIRQAASVTFKNLIKRHWAPEQDDQENGLNHHDKELIKHGIVDLMCSTPPEVQRQISEALFIMSKHDFPERWPGLLPEIVERMQTRDMHVLNGLMMTANSIFKRFRHEMKSDELFALLKYILDSFAEPFLTVLRETAQNTLGSQTAGDLALGLDTLRLMARVFFSLNWQDIPEFFEDSISDWTVIFAKCVEYVNPSLETSSDEEAGPVEKLQAAVIENLNLYATKYEEEFAPFLGNFTQGVWALLTRLGPEPKYDNLVTTSITFLTSIVSKANNAEMFSHTVIGEILEKIVVPNLTAGDADEEAFVMNPKEYIRKDLEGSDVDTRRRAACELVRGMCKFHQDVTTQFCLQFISGMLEQYNQSRQQDWKLKDAAIQLALAISVKAQNSVSGASQLNPLVPIKEIFDSQVLPEITDGGVNDRPLVKADALKFICVFRSQLPSDLMLHILSPLIGFLASDHVVVQTYAAYTIERFLVVKEKQSDGANVPKLGRSDIVPQLEPLFTGLFAVLYNSELPDNEHVMKAMMRLLNTSGPDILPVCGLVLEKLTDILTRVAQNPSNPQFNHFLFEAISVLVRSVCESNSSYADSFEAALVPPFGMILQQDVVEFIPYVFQVLSMLLFYRPHTDPVSDMFKQLLPPFLSPLQWERKGNIPALTELVCVYIRKSPEFIIEQNLLLGILGVFQKLVASKLNEVSAFKLLTSVLSSCPPDQIQPLIQEIFKIVILRLQENTTPRFCKLFCIFMGVCAHKYGPELVEQCCNSLQPGLLLILVLQCWAAQTDALLGGDILDLKCIVGGGARILTGSSVSSEPEVFAKLLASLLITADPDAQASGPVDLDIQDDEESRVFDSSYSRLAFARVPPLDPLDDVSSPGVVLAEALAQLCANNPQYLVVVEALPKDQSNMLQRLLQLAGVRLG